MEKIFWAKICLFQKWNMERLCILQLPYLSHFLMDLSERQFNKIACDSSHPLFDRIIFNNNRMSSLLLCSTSLYNPKCSRSLTFSMSELNKLIIFCSFYNMYSMLLSYFCTHSLLSCCDNRMSIKPIMIRFSDVLWF